MQHRTGNNKMTNIIEFPDPDMKDKERREITNTILDDIAEQIQVLEDQKQEIRRQRKQIENMLRLKKFKIVSSRHEQ